MKASGRVVKEEVRVLIEEEKKRRRFGVYTFRSWCE